MNRFARRSAARKDIGGNHERGAGIHSEEKQTSFAAVQAPQNGKTAVSLAEAVALHQAGRLAEAEKIYREILATLPDHFDCVHLLGVICAQRGQYAEAVKQIDAALKLNQNHFIALNNRGNALFALRRFEEALASYDRALAVRPDSVDTWANRGNVQHQLGRYGEALASYDRTLTLRPDHIEVLANRGVSLLELQRFEEALASCDRALALRPDFAEALSNRGLALDRLERFEEALASHERAIAVRPGYVQAHYNRANTLLALERFDEAAACYGHVLMLQPNYPEALSNRGNALKALKRFDEALASYDRAIELRPSYAKALSNRGNVLREMKRFEEALASYDRAIALRPDFAEAYSNRGLAVESLKRFDEALASYDRALTLRPEFAEAHTNRGLTLQKLKRFDEALASHERALAVKPTYAEAYSNRGLVLEELKRFDEALASYARAIALRPDFAQAHHNESLCRLRIGDLRRGWEKHEWRWETGQLDKARRNFSQKQWLGTDEIAGKKIFVHAEQGFGDTIQFCRYVPLVAERAAQVILEAPKPLRNLMSMLPGVSRIVSTGEPLPDFDMHCPLLSLPLAFGTELATIPAATPYLQVPPDAVTRWSHKLGAKIRPSIGFAWSGSPTHLNDHNRSVGLELLLSAVAGIDATCVSLQREVRAGERALLQRSGIRHFGEELRDFADTAALMANLDLVISVDTSVAHLAGALAKPVWILLPHIPDWRWLLDRNDSPWYPTARLFRQGESRSWDGVMMQIRAALENHVRSL